jgi:hypothetical protein
MMRAALLLMICVLAVASFAGAGPVDGPSWFVKQVEAGRQTTTGELVPGKLRVAVDCRGGERMCVIAAGDHDPVVEMAIAVYDDKGKQVAMDVGGEKVPDYVAAIWYPPRDGKYLVEIASKSKVFNKVTIAIK